MAFQYNRIIKTTLYNISVWCVILIISFPLVWMVLTSLRVKTETYSFPPTFWPQNWTLVHFERLFLDTPFLIYFRNSIIVSVSTTLIVISIAALGAYSLVRFRYPGRQVMGQMIWFTYLLPPAVMIIPLYVIIARLGLTNNLGGLVVAYTTFALPFALWLLRSFIAAMAVEVEDAARVDGASRMRAFFDVVLPQALPGIISTALFSFIAAWNEYLYALVFISEDKYKTLPPGVTHLFRTTYDIEWNLLMAASVVITIPIVSFFAVLQRHLTAGFGAGAVKG